MIKLILDFCETSGDNPPIIVGSQSFHAYSDHLPEIARKSVECDFMLSSSNFSKRPMIDLTLGIQSPYRVENGFFADALGLASVVLPDGWRDRLVPYHDDSGNVIALCADKHDVAVSKFIAGRDKDLEFLASALASGLIEIKQLLERLEPASDKVENDVIPDRLERFIRYLDSVRSNFELSTILKDYKREHF
ncbi:MAG: DUF6036 family nucleotidyltransferase [Pyrinomonadaceae bacterium]